MLLYADTEFNAFGGELISLALVPADKNLKPLYLVNSGYKSMDLHPWVRDNVIPVLYPSNIKVLADDEMMERPLVEFPGLIHRYFRSLTNGTPRPTIIVDWPDDISYICNCLTTGPGTMIGIPNINFVMIRDKDAYPTVLADCVQHNAYWDAVAIRYAHEGN